MVKHIFKLLWNQRKGFVGILVEQFLVFIILLFCIILVLDIAKRYNEPGILNTENVVLCKYMVHEDLWRDRTAIPEIHKTMGVVMENLEKMSEVVAVSEGGAMAPYLRPPENYGKDSIVIGNRKIFTYYKYSDEKGYAVYKPELEEGRWLTEEKLDDGTYQVVITKQLAEEAGWSQSIGKKISIKGRGNIVYTVVGVISGMKNVPLGVSSPTVILPLLNFNDNVISAEYAVRVAAGKEKEFLGNFYREFNRLMPTDKVEFSIHPLYKTKWDWMLSTYMNLVFQAVPTIFLLLFAFIGTFGLFSLYSKKRGREFALRIAIGSDREKLLKLVMLESLVISVTAMLPGMLLFFFIYDLSWLNIIGLLITCLVMLLFSIFSAWYPAYKVSRIEPAKALHFE